MRKKLTAERISHRELKLPCPLRPYQWVGIGFLARCKSALLADEMGLGKTVQAAIALNLLLRQKGCDRVLIVTPASLTINWARELSRWAPEVVLRRLQGSTENRSATYLLPIPVLIASYEQIRIDAKYLDPGIHFDLVILDEAQRIKNANSDTAFACRLLSRTRAWALTGTPVENRTDDLISLFRFLKPGLLYLGMPRKELHRHMRNHFLRRKKKDVLKDLPPIIEQELPLELQGRQREAYVDAWESRKSLAHANGASFSEAHLLALITKLKQLCNFEPISGESLKLESLQLILEAQYEPEDKIIIFSQYVQTLHWLSERLGTFPHEIFHGSLSEQEREQALSTFESESGPRALLISLRAGGVGLNLQAASTVVIFDRWWNPAVEEQAIHRAHRFGRDRPLQVFKFLVLDSIEERISDLLRTKQIMFDQIIESAESAAVPPFSKSDLLQILDLSISDIEGEATNKKKD